MVVDLLSYMADVEKERPKKMTQKELSEISGINRNTLSIEGINVNSHAARVGRAPTSINRIINSPKTFFAYDSKDMFGDLKKIYVPLVEGEFATSRGNILSDNELISRISLKLEENGNRICKLDKETFYVTAAMHGFTKYKLSHFLLFV